MFMLGFQVLLEIHQVSDANNFSYVIIELKLIDVCSIVGGSVGGLSGSEALNIKVGAGLYRLWLV